MIVGVTVGGGAPALAREAAAVVILLERFGGLLADALDAAGRGADDEFAVAVAERARVTTALGNRLARLAILRQIARRNGASAAEVAMALRPVDDALRHAQLLHDRIADEDERVFTTPFGERPALTLVR
ncbi:hypothetical protein tb265_18140 [Gemmatimonadetes bacterium T265]|nr:hypothetical protein tb265_18140 [Gemmatimonadetes bacterium T265]